MYIQKDILRENVSLTVNSTYKLDLPEVGKLSSLFLYLEAVTTAGNPMAALSKWRPIDYIDEVAVVVNGATPVKTLNAKQLQFCNLLDFGFVPPHKWLQYSSDYQRDAWVVNFGRFYGDPDYGLDLSKFDSVEFQFKNSMTAALFSATSLTIIAIYLRDHPGEFGGHMRTENWREWTTVANETKYLEIPTSYPIRRIILQAVADLGTDEESETQIYNVMNDIDLSLKSGLLRVYKGPFEDLMWLNTFETGVFPITGGNIYHTADKGFDVGIGYPTAQLLGAGSKTGAAAATIPSIKGDNNIPTQRHETHEADVMKPFLMQGQALHNCIAIPFDLSPDPFTWLDPEVNKAVLLNITTKNAASAADGTASVVLDRLVRY